MPVMRVTRAHALPAPPARPAPDGVPGDVPGSRHRRRRTARPPLVLAAVAALTAGTLTGCGSPGTDPDTVTIAFRKDTDNKVTVTDDYLRDAAREFARRHPGKKVRLLPVQASAQDYYAKLQQMMRSPKTAPDVVHEDTFLIDSDIESGYLHPLDGRLRTWRDWKRFDPSARRAVTGTDGKTYGVPAGTDTRGIWFNKRIFRRAGLPADWHPRTWNDVLRAARTIKRKVPGVAPLNVFTGKASGETAAMQGFEMLLYGTGRSPLYDARRKKWVRAGRGFRDSLSFVRTVYHEKLGPDVDQALNPSIQTKVMTDLLPKQKLAMDVDGSWLGQQWLKSGGAPWPGWSRTMGLAPMPTQHGLRPGEVSMSGGWAWAISAKSHAPGLAWKLITTLQSKRNAVDWCVRDAQIAARDDVAADHRYLTSMPGIRFFTRRVAHSHYRPALPIYPQVSTALTEAMESVTTGDATVAEAARAYDEELSAITDGAVTRK